MTSGAVRRAPPSPQDPYGAIEPARPSVPRFPTRYAPRSIRSGAAPNQTHPATGPGETVEAVWDDPTCRPLSSQTPQQRCRAAYGPTPARSRGPSSSSSDRAARRPSVGWGKLRRGSASSPRIAVSRPAKPAWTALFHQPRFAGGRAHVSTGIPSGGRGRGAPLNAAPRPETSRQLGTGGDGGAGPSSASPQYLTRSACGGHPAPTLRSPPPRDRTGAPSGAAPRRGPRRRPSSPRRAVRP